MCSSDFSVWIGIGKYREYFSVKLQFKICSLIFSKVFSSNTQFKNVGLFDERFLSFRWQSPSDRYKYSLSSGTDVRYIGTRRKGTRIWRDGAMYGILASSQDPGNVIYLRESWCKFLTHIMSLGTKYMYSRLRNKEAAKY